MTEQQKSACDCTNPWAHDQCHDARGCKVKHKLSQAPADPLDTPLPCDVTVGHGTHKKGTKLRSLVARMQLLYDDAQRYYQLAAATTGPNDPQHIVSAPDEGMELARHLVAMAMQEFVAHHASTIRAAQKMLNDWNHWYGEHGAAMPVPPAGIVRTQELLEEAQAALVTDEMVNRFLAWPLPPTFAPDGGVSFAPTAGTPWPIGTNLLTAEQAKAMLRHVLGA